MIHLPEGTEINALITNALPHALVVRGLTTRGTATISDTIQIAAGATREVRFIAGAPGTYYNRGESVALSALS